MLTILIAKPIQFTKVSPVPVNSEGMAAATKLENCGESAVTAMPQRHHPIKNSAEGSSNSKGDKRQSNPDRAKAAEATLRLPTLSDKIPPSAQDNPPKAIITPVHIAKESLSSLP